MTNPTQISAKATTHSDRSEAIVVSFNASWHEKVLRKNLSVVIRKRVPKNNSISWLYFHINSPISSICAKAKIESVSEISLTEASALFCQIGLLREEIEHYFGEEKNVGCYRLNSIQLARRPLSIKMLSEKLIYYPPQSFFILSKQAKLIIDELAGFDSNFSQKEGK